MPNLISETPEAAAWAGHAKSEHAKSLAFGKVLSSVIWSDAVGPDGEMLVAIDPETLVADVRARPYPLLRGHDPGFPLGEILHAEVFTNPSGTRFIVAVLGLYDGLHLGFDEIGINPRSNAGSPLSLPALPKSIWIDLGTDPRNVDSMWVEEVIREAPVPIKRTTLSHNTGRYAD